MKFHHVGVACRDIKKEIENLTKIHDVTDVGPHVFDAEQNAEVCILWTADGVAIELISGDPVANILKKGITYYHMCFETENIDVEITRLQSLGAHLLSEPKSAILFDNRKVAFLMVSYGLIELLQIG
jgi:methylmalonyl-CoA/ethylmalonyl-CoA epimerase